MSQSAEDRIRWRDNPNAVELGFDHYLSLIERRLGGENISLVQGIRRFYQEELGITLRDTQARGLMHRSASVFIDYAQSILDAEFLPNIEYWEDQGVSRFLQWKDDFYRARNIQAIDIDIEENDTEALLTPQGSAKPPQRKEITVNRIIRDSALSRFLKSLYRYQCQICQFTFMLTNSRRYAETHHIRPLGRHHNGIDNEANMIVLCPNHHAMMDFGAIAILPDSITVVSQDRSLPEHQKPVQLWRHPIDKQFLEYHLENIYNKI